MRYFEKDENKLIEDYQIKGDIIYGYRNYEGDFSKTFMESALVFEDNSFMIIPMKRSIFSSEFLYEGKVQVEYKYIKSSKIYTKHITDLFFNDGSNQYTFTEETIKKFHNKFFILEFRSVINELYLFGFFKNQLNKIEAALIKNNLSDIRTIFEQLKNDID